MNNISLLKLKEEYDHIEIPLELSSAIQTGIERGRKEVNARTKKFNRGLKICASFAVALTLFVGGINMSPAFAETLKDIPIVGKLVEVLKFTDGKSGGGDITDGTDISHMGLIKEDGFENIVINFSQNDGLQENTGVFQVSYEENPYTMTLEIGGARRFSAEKTFEKILESKYVKDVYKIITLDDSLIRFVIEFEGPVKYQVKEMKEPAGIVIRLKEDPKAMEKQIYSLRTKSYPYGEAFGILEERLMPLNPLRVLKDEEGMYLIEIESFETKEAAVKKFDEIDLAKDVIFIEERVGAETPKNDPVAMNTPDINEENSMEENHEDPSEESALYPVSINENDEYYYGNIEILDKGLNIYGEDKNGDVKHYLSYEDVTLTKLHGEASYILIIDAENKKLTVSGVFSDFFEELKKYAEITQ